jgi:hypothetical protein
MRRLTEEEKNQLRAKIQAQQQKQTSKRPPLQPWRIISEMLVGGVGAVVIYTLLFLILAPLMYMMHRQESNTVRLLLMIGAGFGSSLGVCLVGNSGNETGFFLVTLSGGILSSLVGGGLVFFWVQYSARYWGAAFAPYWGAVEAMLGVPGAVFGGTIGATIGFNKTRRYK